MTLATMTAPTKTFDLPDPNDPAACSRWLQDRYMKSERDDDFIDALHEILETDAQGNLTATPLRVGLPQDTRGLMVLGQSGYGKASLIKRNLKNQPAIGLTDGNELGAALYHLVPPEATLKSVAVEIANACGYPKVKDGTLHHSRGTSGGGPIILRIEFEEKVTYATSDSAGQTDELGLLIRCRHSTRVYRRPR